MHVPSSQNSGGWELQIPESTAARRAIAFLFFYFFALLYGRIKIAQRFSGSFKINLNEKSMRGGEGGLETTTPRMPRGEPRS